MKLEQADARLASVGLENPGIVTEIVESRGKALAEVTRCLGSISPAERQLLVAIQGHGALSLERLRQQRNQLSERWCRLQHLKTSVAALHDLDGNACQRMVVDCTG